MDVAAIEPGRDFRRAIDEQVASCGVLLAIIGKSWLTAKDESGARRLDDPMDFVRLETASALKRDIPVVPVLVHAARMPAIEVMRALVEFGFGSLGLKEIYGGTVSGNARIARLVSAFGAVAIARPTPAWMAARG